LMARLPTGRFFAAQASRIAADARFMLTSAPKSKPEFRTAEGF
jgi:hypothetical protein